MFPGALLSDRWLGSRRSQALVLLGLAIAFVSFRWLQRLEPWNSDDIELFQFSVEAATGHHWALGSPVSGALPHTAFRIGLLPASVLAIKAFGATSTAYYLVPLGFSLLGFGVVYWVLRTQFGALVALSFAVIHVAWPYELQHASVLLTDLPCAAMGLLSLCLLAASSPWRAEVGTRRGPRGRVLFALLAGLAAWETYLLRNNGLVLLGPAWLVFLWSRETRWQTLIAGGVVLLGVLGQQSLLIYRGLGWGYDWSSVRADFAAYAPFLPVYSWPGFLLRQFSYQVSSFGRGAPGLLAALLVVGSLLLHVLLLRFERRPLLLAIAIFGLFSWLVFSFSIYERVPGGVRAMVPVNFRFIQPFTYSSLVAWAWGWQALRQRWGASGEAPRAAPWPRRLALAAVPLVLLGFSYGASAFRLPETYREGATRRLVQALEQLSAGQEPLVIAGTGPSLQVARVFCCDGSRARIRWLEQTPEELARRVEQRATERGEPHGVELVLRDVPRELESARYLEPQARARYRAELARVEAALWRDYALVYLDDKHGVYRRREQREPLAQLEALAARADVGLPEGAPLSGATRCRELPARADGGRILLPPEQGLGRATCESSWLADGIELAALPAADELRGGRLVLRAAVQYEPPLSVSVEVIQADAQNLQRQILEPKILERKILRRQSSALSPGTTHVPVNVEPNTRTLLVVYRVGTRGALGARDVVIEPAQWRALSDAPSGIPTAVR